MRSLLLLLTFLSLAPAAAAADTLTLATPAGRVGRAYRATLSSSVEFKLDAVGDNSFGYHTWVSDRRVERWREAWPDAATTVIQVEEARSTRSVRGADGTTTQIVRDPTVGGPWRLGGPDTLGPDGPATPEVVQLLRPRFDPTARRGLESTLGGLTLERHKGIAVDPEQASAHFPDGWQVHRLEVTWTGYGKAGVRCARIQVRLDHSEARASDTVRRDVVETLLVGLDDGLLRRSVARGTAVAQPHDQSTLPLSGKFHRKTTWAWDDADAAALLALPAPAPGQPGLFGDTEAGERLASTLSEVRDAHLARLDALERGPDDLMEPLIREGELLEQRWRRLDRATAADGELSEPFELPSGESVPFAVIDLTWGSTTVRISPFPWDAAAISIAGHSPQRAEQWLRPWFDRAIRPEQSAQQGGPVGAVHMLSEGMMQGAWTTFVLDLGSAPVEALRDLLDEARRSGVRELRIH